MNMEFKVKNLFVRISSRKVRPVLYGLRGLSGEAALVTLNFTNKKGARYAYELLKSGLAAAKENYFEPNEVHIKEIFCDEGPRLKRMIPWSKGQSRRITKRMSHLTLVLEANEKPKVETKAKEDVQDKKIKKAGLKKEETKE